LKTLKIIDGNFVRTSDDKSWEWLEDSDAIKQRIKHRLMLWKGEWFLDQNQGIDWINIFEKPFSLRKLTSEVVKALKKDEYVDKIEEINIVPDYNKRSLLIKIKVLSGSAYLDISKEFKD
jgi:hypothetical protein